MRTNAHVGCDEFPCPDVNYDSYVIPGIDVKPAEISLVMISEAARVE
ncbi:MAG: hypothetical protein QF369_00445 [Dehalococcoidales bacterium]|jgi:hypothetical protein|nr:hypothetical protein [Dehalococcoidales bacterium]MDP6500959.1 hypothetical protein [Dehalococcoidales bacterium]